MENKKGIYKRKRDESMLNVIRLLRDYDLEEIKLLCRKYKEKKEREEKLYGK